MDYLGHLLSTKLMIFYLFVISACYIQLRGHVRLKFTRQFVNHSTFMAPFNCLYYLFSSVPNKPFVGQDNFPELNLLQDNWETIRDEGIALLKKDYINIAKKNDDIGFNSFYKRGWKRFYLKWYNECPPSAEKLCPKTVNLLKQIPYLKGAMYTFLPAQGIINPHRDPYAGSLRYHLGLVTPNSDDCSIFVDGQPYAWRDGHAVIFDETFVHYAYNKTNQDRLILFCDIERPINNPIIRWVNRFISQHVMGATASPNLEGDKTGGINVFYQYVHKIKEFSGSLKKKNRYAYKTLEYSIVLAVLYWIIFV